MSERPYLSIGEVLGLLLEEFPDITISKIRFLESQGLIEPERTPSGYRKFYDDDVDRLRFILREQRENYLPLKVIRDRLGDTPPAGLPRGIRNVTIGAAHEGAPTTEASVTDVFDDPYANDGSNSDLAPTGSTVLEDGDAALAPGDHTESAADVADDLDDAIRPSARVTRTHPSARGSSATLVASLVEPPIADPTDKLPVPTVPTPAPARPPAADYSSDDTTGSLARVIATHLTRAELLEKSGVTGATLDELESYGLVTPRTLGQQIVYEPQSAVVAEVAAAFVELGIEVRHLKAWRTAADKEAALFEQRISPLLRQRNPQARDQSIEILDKLMQLGGRMRGVMVEQALRQYIEPH